jgi:transmembrane sensor
MNRRAFQRILHRYAEGQSPADERALVEQWYALLDDPDQAEPQSAAYWRRIEARIWQRIQPNAGQRGTIVRPLRAGRFSVGLRSIGLHSATWRYGLAACLALALGVASWWVVQQSPAMTESADQLTGLTETTNQSQQPQRVQLTDGSRVTLQPGSRVRYPARFAADKREVYLTGIAFFEVVKHPKQPFFVYANELTTKVLGTSFWVRALPGDPQVQVVVRTGRVSVFGQTTAAAVTARQPQTAAGLILTPNQQVVFDRRATTFSKSLVAQPVAVQPFDFRFRNAPVSDVLRAIGQAYGITLVYDEDLLSRCPLTATLTQESLYGKLDLICKAIGADYQLIDGQIVVNTKGCE